MSVTISNCNEICSSPTNTSPSKMLYTFSRGERFPRRRIIMCDKFYDPHSQSFNRTTSLGVGNKYDFTKNGNKSPPPNTYNIKSEFQSKDKKKGFGFGCSRQELEVTGPFVETLKNRNPGPGSYEMKGTLQCTSFSLRGKIEHEDQQKIKVPGPGYYPVTFSINQKGRYFLSKYKNHLVGSFKTNQNRNKNADNKVPGPGAYSAKNIDISSDGKYCLSRIPSVLTRRFGNSARSQIIDKCETPGPGNYRLPSQFGHYLARNAVKKPATEQTNRKNIKQGENKQNVKE